MTITVAVLFFALCSIPSITGPQLVDVHVIFPFTTGVQGIAEGTPVMMGGMQFGHVKAVNSVEEMGSEPSAFQVTLSVQKGVAIPRTATVAVSQSVLGTGARLVIFLPSNSGALHLGSNDEIAAAPAQSTLELLLGNERAKSFEVAIDTFQKFDMKPSVQDAKERWTTLYNEAAAFRAQAGGDVELWRPQAIAVLDGFDAARARIYEIEALFGPGEALDRARLEPSFERIRNSFTQSAELIASMRSHWTQQVLPPLSDLVDRFKKSLAVAQADYERLKGILDATRSAAGSVTADLQIAGHQLQSAEREITLMPWTLLGGTFSQKGEQAQFMILARELVRSTAELHLSVTFAKDLLTQDPKLVERYPELCDLLSRWMTRAAADQNASANNILDRLIGTPNPK